MTAAARVRPLAAVQQVFTLAWRTLVQVRHNPLELVDLSITPLMFVFLFTFVFGGAIADSPREYLQFMLPGIVVQNTLFATIYTAMGLNADLTKGVFDRLRSLPIARSAPLAGRILADTVKQAWAIALLLAIGFALGFRATGGAPGVLAAAGLMLLFALGASWLAVLVGVLASDSEKVQAYGFTTLFPLTFTSNIFVQTETMPAWLQAWVRANPVTLLADAMRGLMVGGPVARPALYSLAWAAGLALVFAPLAVRAVRRRV